MKPEINVKPEVLLVDDNPADVELTSEVLSRCSALHKIRTAADGEQAMDYLRDHNAHRQPDLVILDLNMPRKDGRSVLTEVKTDPALRCTPIVVFSSSQAGRDVQNSLELGANSYVAKPGNLQDFVSTVTSIGEYWLKCAVLPSRNNHD
jgi:CheY-like chemotaxis protein